MSRFTPVVAGLLLIGAYPISAQDISVEDTVNFDLRAIGQTQGAGVPNAVGLGAFVPLHKTSNAVTYVDIEVKGNVADRSGDSSIINTEVAGTTPSSSTRLGYRRLNESGQMYGVYAGYDTIELKAGPVDTTVVVTDPRTVDFQQAAVGAEFVSNQWRFDLYALIPTGATEQILNSHYLVGALDTYGADVGYQINDKTKVSVGYYYQHGDLNEADGGGVSTGLNYDITNNLTAGLKVSYDDAFDTRVMATINWSLADLLKGDEDEKERTTNMLMSAMSATSGNRDVRLHDGFFGDIANWFAGAGASIAQFGCTFISLECWTRECFCNSCALTEPMMGMCAAWPSGPEPTSKPANWPTGACWPTAINGGCY